MSRYEGTPGDVTCGRRGLGPGGVSLMPNWPTEPAFMGTQMEHIWAGAPDRACQCDQMGKRPVCDCG